MAATAKADVRLTIHAARRALHKQTHAREAAALATLVASLVGEGEVTCAYVPTGTEPGSLTMLQALRAGGSRVLLPLTRSPGYPLDWAEFTGTGDLRDAEYGLREPTADPLGPAAIAGARLVLVPALAVDRAGHRLGRGAGFYDRSLTLADPAARLVAVVRAAEVLAELPHEEHDIAMDDALTPAGLISLGTAL
ncbi:MAG: 5-formyltetrahydrofolate cyclo-ligase [Mycobacteriaceae bacterium]